MITVVGMGVNAGDLTRRALEALKKADEVILRTALTPSADSIRAEGIAFTALDFLYERSRNFDTLQKNIVKELTVRGADKNICYCVDGAVSEDRAARSLILRGANVVEGVGKAANAAALAGVCGAYLSVSAYELKGCKLTTPLVVYDLDDRELAGDVKLLLAEKFGDECPAFFVTKGVGKKISLYQADRGDAYDFSTALVVYDVPLLEKKKFDFEDFVEILRRLRAPDGCPWDRAQTHESIRINMIEEAYELVDAIDSGDSEKRCEEEGDVLMQAVFHALIDEDRGEYTLTDMIGGVCEKLVSRHTHVFGTDKAAGADGALSVWDKNKMTEKHQVTFSDAVNDVPQCFPALLRAQKIVKRMSKGGWDFQTPENCKKKFEEEASELEKAVRGGDKAELQGEFGDVLMVLAHTAFMLGIDAEQSLLDVVKKTAARYNEWEKLVLADGKDVHGLTDEERNTYYKQAKKNVSDH